MKPITARQASYLNALCNERPQWAQSEGLSPERIDRLSVQEGSYWINEALSQERPTIRPTPERDVPEMIHYPSATKDVYRVRRSRGGRLYCMKLIERHGQYKWNYVGSQPLALLSTETIMTMDDMADYGRTLGICLRCAAALNDQKSVERGMGPVCHKKTSEEFAERAAARAAAQLAGAEYVEVA